MYVGGGNGGGGEAPDDGFRGVPRSVILALRIAAGLAALLIFYLFISFWKGAYTDWLWFSNLGFRDVFRTVLLTRTTLYFTGLGLSGAALAIAYRYAWRSAWGPTALALGPLAILWIRRAILVALVLMSVIIAVSFAGAFADRWQVFLRFWRSADFGVTDPQFGNDVSFYVFQMPLWHALQGWFMGLAIVILLTTTALHFLIYSARGVNAAFTDRSKNQLAVVGAFLMVTIAAAHFLDRYETLFSLGGAVTGATYADVNARIPALQLLTVVALISAAMMLFTLRMGNLRQALRLIAVAFSLWVVAGILAGLIWPALVQRFAVDPSELERERPYIQRNIEWTRRGFDLERIQASAYNVTEDTLRSDIANSPGTINNIRLWDPRPLENVLNQIQHLRLYYNFLDVDVDRYTVDGRYRQVLVGAREIFQNGLDESAQNWVNRKLVYTHGYGAVMSTATDFTPGGQPNLLLKDVPPTGVLPLEQPRIYYGESYGLDANLVQPDPERGGDVTDDVVIVNTDEPQFDRPGDSADAPPHFIDRYDGAGGVPLDSFFRRFAYSWELGDVNILISSQLTSDSRVLYRRSVADRVRTVAPFLELDDDPYLVIADGRLQWIQDAYTQTDRFPYSKRIGTSLLTDNLFSRPVNYVRNTVKVVIDAYDGSMTFYTIEIGQPDPILQVHRNIFPGLFTPIEQMPPSLREHIRYPEELLEAQADTFLQYHMTDPKEFFLKEDQWELGEETVGQGTTRVVDPYYVIMKLPDAESEEFVQILPFTPQDKPNLVAWMAARSDGEHYGDITVFQFPTDRPFAGTSQIEARIDNDPRISEQFTLWDQSGSRVIRGNLLVIPIGVRTVDGDSNRLEGGLLYAEPIYIQADSLTFPELKRVVLATNTDVVMEATLDESIAALLGGAAPSRRPDDGEPVPGGIPPEQLQTALEGISEAIESLRGGTDELDESIQALRELAGEPSTP